MAPSYKYQKVGDANSNKDLDFDNIDSRLKIEQSTFSKIDLQQTVWYKRPFVFWLLPIFLLFNLAMGAMNGTANYAAGAVAIGDYNPQCSIDSVESATAMLQLYGNLIAGILGAIAAPIGGKLSDRYG